MNAGQRIEQARAARPGDYPGRGPAAVSGPGVQAVTVADVERERLSWLWPGYMPLGKLVVLDGDPGQGKSTLTLDLAARVSVDSPMPDGSACGRPGSALLLSAEDGIGDTIRPRLEAAGADLTRVHVLTETLDDEQRPRPVDLSADLAGIRAHVARLGATLVVVDPLMAFLGSGTDSHRDQDVRRALHPLADMAAATGTTVVIVRHLNKSSAGSAIYRGGGSIGIAAAARAVFLVASDPEDPELRVLAPTKSNLAKHPQSLAYRLVDDAEHGCAQVVWQGVSERRADDLLGATEEHGERDEAVTFLTGLLEMEPLPAKVVLARARDAGVSERTLKRAKSRLGVKSERVGFGEDGRWLWSLPEALEGQRGTKGATRESWPPKDSMDTGGPLRLLPAPEDEQS